MKKRILAILLSLCMVISMMPATALAQTESQTESQNLDLCNGSIVISENGYTQNGVDEVSYSGDYIISQTNNESATLNTIMVTGGTHTITLNGVNIDVSTAYNEGDIPCAFAIAGGDVTLILAESSVNTLKSGYSGINDIDVCFAGIWVKQGASLTINGAGQLDVYAGAKLYSKGNTSIGNRGYGAGIGACSTDTSAANKEYATVGSITIAGGTVNATAASTGYGGAGIGGGSNPSTITISGGTVTALSKGSAAGIGGTFGVSFSFKSTKTIRISGGVVNATGGAAGIGGAITQPAYDISISGGTVIATSTGTGAGIGGGGGDYNGAFDKVTGGTISISGGNVTAQGCKYGAGIGGGGAGDSAGASYGGGGSGNITISGGVVKATGGDFAPGIGGGSTAKSDSTKKDAGLLEDIIITGGNVIAVNGNGYTTGWKLNGVDTGIGQGMNPGTTAQAKYETWKLKGTNGLPVLEKKALAATSDSVLAKRNGEAFLTVTPTDGSVSLWLIEGCYQVDDGELFLVSADGDEKTNADNLISTLNAAGTSSITVSQVQGYEAAYNGLSEGARYYVDQKVTTGHKVGDFKEALKNQTIYVKAVLDSNGGSNV